MTLSVQQGYENAPVVNVATDRAAAIVYHLSEVFRQGGYN